MNLESMEEKMTIKVPEGMSCVNAFYALWENAKDAPAAQPYLLVNEGQATFVQPKQEVDAAEKIANLFKMRTYEGSVTFFDYEGGRGIKTDFSNFPVLKVANYDRLWGKDAAEKAIRVYCQTPSSERFDKNDSYDFHAITGIKKSFSSE